MKRQLHLLFCIIAFSSSAQLRIEGNYIGTDLYIQNPNHDDTDVSCVDSVTVNGTNCKVDLEMAAFQIKLSELNLEIDDAINIVIYHKEGCKPKVLNQSHQFTSNLFQFDAISLVENEIKWTAENDVPGKFKLEVYRWNKWVLLDTLNRELGKSEYSTDIINRVHSGENTFRIKFVSQSGKSFTSQSVKFENTIEPVQFEMDKKTNILTFNRTTNYEIYDEFGVRKISGTGNKVLLYRLGNKKYYLNLDNRNEELKLKR